MQQDTITLILGITFGLAVVGVVIGITMLMARANAQTVVMPSTDYVTYKNEERWSVIKDADGRLKDIIVHREATER